MAKGPIYVPHELKKSRGWSVLHPLHDVMDNARTRMVVVAAVFVIAFSAISLRLIDLCVLRGEDDPSLMSRSKAGGSVHLRADIVDRHGQLLATSLRTSSLFANARVTIDPTASAQKLVTVLKDLDVKAVDKKLRSGKGFIWIARHLTPLEQADVIRLGIPGLYFKKDERRVYPHGPLFSHVIGFTDIDSHGLAGIERKFDRELNEMPEPIQLSLDLRVQHILRDELVQGVDKFKAQGGAGLVMNVKTGEIVAMVSLPDYDPHRVGDYQANSKPLFNRTSLGIYEMGSSFKIFNTAMVLETGTAELHHTFDVTKPLKIGRFRITDYHPSDRWMDVTEIFIKSSNIGAAKLALKAGANLQQAFFKTLGLFEPLKFELPEISAPLYPKRWEKATIITASYGYGISISMLHLARAVGGIVNRGMMVNPTLRKLVKGAEVQGQRVVSEDVSLIIRDLLQRVVVEGTGRKASVKGFEVGGKTGTANQLTDKGWYQNGKNSTSFTAVFPMRDPQYLVCIMLDRPQGIKETYGYNAGGWNAAPIAGNVIGKAALLLSVSPVPEVKEPGANPTFLNVSAHR